MFTAWALEQHGQPGYVGKFSQVIWDDINNGCSPMLNKTVLQWKEHFYKEHPKSASEIHALLVEAYVAYVASFSDEK